MIIEPHEECVDCQAAQEKAMAYAEQEAHPNSFRGARPRKATALAAWAVYKVRCDRHRENP